MVEEEPATDDAALVECMGGTVKVVLGDPRNFKVTTPEDLRLAEAMLGARASRPL
ncbi:MAG: 2-C-methyl-D-erythritol 4-phosphate cytidylyltransferase [Candidatus Binatia bacterium]